MMQRRNSSCHHQITVVVFPAVHFDSLQYTVHGIDTAMKQFFISVENLLQAHPSEVNLRNKDLEYIWEVSSCIIAMHLDAQGRGLKSCQGL
jgi:hypothetical protein